MIDEKDLEGLKEDSWVKESLSILTSNFKMDANETAFLERQITQLRAKEFDVIYEKSVARSFMPLATDIASSASVYAYKVYDRTAEAKIGGNDADDAPLVEVGATERLGKVVSVRSAYAWGLNDAREAARLRVPLSARKQMAAKDAIERKIDQSLFDGAGVAGMNGVANAPDVPTVNITEFTQATPVSDIVSDLNALLSQVRTQSKGEYDCTAMLMPQAQFEVLNTKFVGVDNTMTILKAFLANNPGLTIAPWTKLDDPIGGNTRIIAGQMTADVLEGVVPQEFEQLSPQNRNMSYVVNCHARVGGVKVYQPLGMVYGIMS